MHVVLSIIVFIITLSLIIIIHELGHFIFAKKAGILCYEFSLGMGPKIWSKKKGETVYSIRAIPIGGYVSMAGEEGTGINLEDDMKIGFDLENDQITNVYLYDKGDYQGTLKGHEIYKEMYLEIMDEEGLIKKYNLKKDAFFKFDNGSEIQAAPYDRCFESKTLWQRFLAIFAGPLMNFVLGIIVMFIYSFSLGVPDNDSNIVGTAMFSATEAEVISKDGILTGELNEEDRTVSIEGLTITEINGTTVSSFNDVRIVVENMVSDEVENMELKAHNDQHNYELLIKPYVFCGSLGIYTKTAEEVSTGVKSYLYCVNAENAGFIDGSIITRIDDKEIETTNDLIDFTKNHDGNNIRVYAINPEGEAYYVEYKMYDTETVEKLDIERCTVSYGFAPIYNVKFAECFKNSFVYFKDNATSVFDTLDLLFTSKDVGVKNLSGPVGIYQLVSSTLSSGFISFISLLGLLTINIGIVNLLPIPALDGGRIVFLGYELITRRKPNKKFENALNSIMFILIMILFVYITFNDILRF